MASNWTVYQPGQSDSSLLKDAQKRRQRVDREVTGMGRGLRKTSELPINSSRLTRRASSRLLPIANSVMAEPHAMAGTQPLARKRISQYASLPASR